MSPLKWFRASLNMGHLGAGKTQDETVYIQAPDAVAALNVATDFPGAKKGLAAKCQNSIMPVDMPPAFARRWYWRASMT